MSDSLASLWQLHTEFTLLLCITLAARHLLRRHKKNHHAYLVWLCIPLGLLGAYLVSLLGSAQTLPLNAQVVQQYLRQPVETLSQMPSSTTPHTLVWLWAAIALLAFGHLLQQHRKLRQSLRAISRGQNEVLNSRYPIITVDSDELSPAVYGFIKPKIYLPLQVQNKLSEQQLRLITRHEEQHIRQGHLWLNLMWDVLVCLLWFNPLVYLARQQFRHDQELYCDYLVLNAQDEDSSRSYGHALLTTITATHSVSLLCSWNAFNQLEDRIMNIKLASKKSGKGLLLMATLVIVSATSLYAVGGHGEGDEVKEIQKEVMIKKGEAGKSLVKIKKNDKEFVEEDGKRYVVENGKQRKMTSAESVEFDDEKKQVAEYEKSKHDHAASVEHGKGKKIIRIEKDKHDGEAQKMIRIEKEVHHGDHDGTMKRIKIVKNDKVFEQVDGKLFIIENGKKRSATAQESKEFEKEMKEARQHIKEAEIEKELEALHELDVDFDGLAGLLNADQLNIEGISVDFEHALKALEQIDMQNLISEAELESGRAALIEARKNLTLDEDKIRQAMDVARLELERVKERWQERRTLSEPH